MQFTAPQSIHGSTNAEDDLSPSLGRYLSSADTEISSALHKQHKSSVLSSPRQQMHNKWDKDEFTNWTDSTSQSRLRVARRLDRTNLFAQSTFSKYVGALYLILLLMIIYKTGCAPSEIWERRLKRSASL
jgi:hypothetical protein